MAQPACLFLNAGPTTLSVSPGTSSRGCSMFHLQEQEITYIMNKCPSVGLLYTPKPVTHVDLQDLLFADSITAVPAGKADMLARIEGDGSLRDSAFLAEQLDRIERKLDSLIELRTIRDWYGIPEAAEILGKAEFTVREWCRLGRVNAEKRPCGRGRSQEWIIAHSEILRIQKEGLLPAPQSTWKCR